MEIVYKTRFERGAPSDVNEYGAPSGVISVLYRSIESYTINLHGAQFLTIF